MATNQHHFDDPQQDPNHRFDSWRYWLLWGVALFLMAYGAHRYFEYRNEALDRRLELLQKR